MKQSQPSTRPSASKSNHPSQRADSLAPDGVRREHERFSVDLQVSVLSEHNFYAGLAENLSAGGLFIATHKLQKVGSKIELSLRMPDSEEVFQVEGEVRWVRVYNEHSDTSPGLGIRFLQIPSAATSAINRFLGQREPLFFDDD
jgi:uncharacterized protein (TIGR02266 family)